MKKFILCVLAAVIAAVSAFALAACGGSSLGDFYGKTFTITGKALAINWDKKCVKDNGPDNSTGSDSSEYSYKQLLDKYWARTDWANENSGFKGMSFSSSDEFITYVNGNLNDVFKGYAGTKFVFGGKDEHTVKIISPDGQESVDFIRLDSEEIYNQYRGSFDMRSYAMPQNYMGDSGKTCYAIADLNDDGKYESAVRLSYTAYIVNDEAHTLEYEIVTFREIDGYGNMILDCVTNHDVQNYASLFITGSPVSYLTLPLYPEITEE